MPRLDIRMPCIDLGSPRERDFLELFNEKLCDDPLDSEIFFTLQENRY